MNPAVNRQCPARADDVAERVGEIRKRRVNARGQPPRWRHAAIDPVGGVDCFAHDFLRFVVPLVGVSVVRRAVAKLLGATGA